MLFHVLKEWTIRVNNVSFTRLLFNGQGKRKRPNNKSRAQPVKHPCIIMFDDDQPKLCCSWSFLYTHCTHVRTEHTASVALRFKRIIWNGKEPSCLIRIKLNRGDPETIFRGSMNKHQKYIISAIDPELCNWYLYFLSVYSRAYLIKLARL